MQQVTFPPRCLALIQMTPNHERPMEELTRMPRIGRIIHRRKVKREVEELFMKVSRKLQDRPFTSNFLTFSSHLLK